MGFTSCCCCSAGLNKLGKVLGFRMEDSSEDHAGCSTPSADSLEYSRTISEVSSYSEHSCLDDAFSLGWPISAKSTTTTVRSPAVLTKLGMKQHCDLVPSGKPNNEEEEKIAGEVF